MAKPIGTLGVIDTLTIGGRVFTDLANLITLFAEGGSTNGFTTFRQPNASSGYTPSGSNSFLLAALYINPSAPSLPSTGIAYGYGDTDVGVSSASPPTNPVYPGNSVTITDIIAYGSTTNLFQPTLVYPNFKTPNTKYPFFSNDSGAGQFTCQGYGYEVP
jgi:hypothetical protein